MLEKPEEVKEAVARIVEGRLTVWNARMELAMRVGDVQKIDQLLAHSPVADGIGCDCGCGALGSLRDRAQFGLGEGR